MTHQKDLNCETRLNHKVLPSDPWLTMPPLCRLPSFQPEQTGPRGLPLVFLIKTGQIQIFLIVNCVWNRDYAHRQAQFLRSRQRPTPRSSVAHHSLLHIECSVAERKGKKKDRQTDRQNNVSGLFEMQGQTIQVDLRVCPNLEPYHENITSIRSGRRLVRYVMVLASPYSQFPQRWHLQRKLYIGVE